MAIPFVALTVSGTVSGYGIFYAVFAYLKYPTLWQAVTHFLQVFLSFELPASLEKHVACQAGPGIMLLSLSETTRDVTDKRQPIPS